MRDETARLPVAGAKLHYRVRGTGPALLLMQGGDSDAEGTEGLVRHLTGTYTVITYDRRGLSRSTIAQPVTGHSVEVHVDDAHHLLTTVTDQPAYVVGSSFGAVVGLALTAIHPSQVRRVVAHEPPLTEALTATERTDADRFHDTVIDTYREHGADATMGLLMRTLHIDITEREPDVELTPPGPNRAANTEFFLTHDFPALRRFRLDLTGAATWASLVVAAGGSTTPEPYPRRCARALADRFGTRFAEFPGGHAGFTTHPRASTKRLTEILRATS